MAAACHTKHQAKCDSCGHSCLSCAHKVQGPATKGSGNVKINGKPAFREQDTGIHKHCCDQNKWKAVKGSSTVKINGQGAMRKDDPTLHCEKNPGQMIEGSENVFIGD